MKKVLKIFLWSILGIAVIGVFFMVHKKNQKKEVHYKIEEAFIADTIEKKTVLTGTINPRNEINLKPQISGIVAEVFYESGQMVKQGDIIARLSVVPDMQQASNAESQVRLNEIALQQAEEKYLRDKDLFEKGVVSREEFENSRAAYLQRKENMTNSIENRDIIKTGRSASTSSSTTTLVRSTISGTILDIPVKVGSSVIQANTFNDGTTIAVVADMEDLLFTGKADETVVGELHEGMNVRISIGALGEKNFPAVIEFIAPKGVVTDGVNQYEMKAALKLAKGSHIRAGYGANAEVVLEGVYNVLAIPESCVKYENGKPYCIVVTSGNGKKTERRELELGLSNGLNVQVLKGLKKGEKVRGAVII